MFIDRCSLEKPSSLDRLVLTISPSKRVTRREPSSRNRVTKPLAKVDLPEPDNPVKKIVKPLFVKGGFESSNSCATLLKVNHSGIPLPLSKSCLNSVPESVLYSSS